VDDIGPQQIPNELIRRVMDALHQEEQLATLSTMALASRALYELAIPKIYETIVVTENNMDKVPRIREDKSFSVGRRLHVNLAMLTRRNVSMARRTKIGRL
jgi:hypothetical protein